jgi:hypothetical protein
MESKALSVKSWWKENIVQYFLIVAPILVNLRYILKHSLNIPRYDDYDSVLEFVYNFKNTPFPSNLPLLFRQHIEHRIFTTRLTAALYYYVFGNINFKGIILLNFCLGVVLFIVLATLIKKIIPRYWLWAAAVLSLCLFDLINSDLSNWAMSGVQNYGVILFFIVSMRLYGRKEIKYVIPAMTFQVLCIYTSGNGHVGSLFIVAYNILSKNRLNSVLSVIIMLIFSSLYYYHYHSAASMFTSDLTKVVPFFFHNVGAHFSFEYGILAGIVMLAFTVFLLPIKIFDRFKVNQELLPFICLVGFVFASQVIMSFFRGNLPVIVAYSSRYLIYSHLLLVSLFVWLLYKKEFENLEVSVSTKSKVFSLPLIGPIVAMVVISYFFNSFDGRESFKSMHRTLMTERYFFPDSVKARVISENACRQGIYCIEKERVEH